MHLLMSILLVNLWELKSSCFELTSGPLKVSLYYEKLFMKLTALQVLSSLKVTDFSKFKKPDKNKGSRGQLLETALGIPNSSDLKDLADGELKSFTLGESVAVTQLKHCLSEIIEDKVSFKNSKVGEKLQQTIYVAFSRSNDYINSTLLNEETHPEHYQELAEDYAFICDKIRTAFDNGEELNTITGTNGLLQIRTKASKSNGSYTPLTFKNVTLKNKYMAFYLCGKFGKELTF